MVTCLSPFSAAKIIMPLAVAAILWVPFCASAQNEAARGKTVVFRGYKIEMAAATAPDTVSVTDPITGDETVTVTRRDPKPLTVNGEHIYDINEAATNPVFKSKDFTFRTYIMEHISPELKKLPDGSYYLYMGYTVVSSKGDIAYDEFEGITPGHATGGPTIPANLKAEINKKVEETINYIQATPAQLAGKNIPVLFSDNKFTTPVTVKNHLVTY